ncbi:hypothetical protein B2H94_09930 [Clostridium sporogenes]|uniref:GmrSD restriction endonucleases N-terminal domain-containing protein n=1 Tax=Clostridium sporogenes TaxID=1509 RepID=A0ABD6RSH9_CLOSG|nr:DUF262 domain-containing protein [Clostridium sporogenes]OSB19391.1 hypothetical protein B2H94_09930 [Clostridium sporogenes]
MNNLFELNQDIDNKEDSDHINELEKEKDFDKKEIRVNDLLDRKITYKTKSMDIETILNGLKRGDYLLPKYQRKYVWEKVQAANLILSLIKNIPIPPIYLYYNNADGKYVILDGQQRITTIFMYYKSVFYKGSKDRKRFNFKEISTQLDKVDLYKEQLKLYKDMDMKIDINKIKNNIKEIYNNLEKKYNIKKTNFELDTQDITFENFNEKSKRILIRKDLEVVFVQCDDKNPHRVYTEIFKLLNSAGKELSNQEIRNGVYSDNFLYEQIDDFNEGSSIWRQIYGNSRTSKDFEYLLRFLALDRFTNYVDEKTKSEVKLDNMKNFSLGHIIDQYSEEFNKRYSNDSEDINVEEINEEIKERAIQEKEKLVKFFDKIVDIKEEMKVTGGKILILEAIFVAFSKLKLLDKDIKIEYFSLINSLDLKKDFGIGTSTSNKGNVEKRLLKAIQIVKEKYKDECQ